MVWCTWKPCLTWARCPIYRWNSVLNQFLMLSFVKCFFFFYIIYVILWLSSLEMISLLMVQFCFSYVFKFSINKQIGLTRSCKTQIMMHWCDESWIINRVILWLLNFKGIFQFSVYATNPNFVHTATSNEISSTLSFSNVFRILMTILQLWILQEFMACPRKVLNPIYFII